MGGAKLSLVLRLGSNDDDDDDDSDNIELRRLRAGVAAPTTQESPSRTALHWNPLL